MRRSAFLLMLALVLSMCVLLTGCSSSEQPPSGEVSDIEQSQPVQQTQAPQQTVQTPSKSENEPQITMTLDDRIPVELSSPELVWVEPPNTVPEAQDISELEYAFRVSGTSTGVMLAEEFKPGVTEYNLNALAAGETLSIYVKAPDGMTVTINGETAAVNSDNTVVVDQISRDHKITVTFSSPMGGGRQYVIHTYPTDMPQLNYTVYEKEMLQYGVYSFSLEPYLIRMDTNGDVVYYRSFAHLGDAIVENLKPVQYEDGTIRFVYYMETNNELRSSNGGFSSGVYIVMDEQYREIRTVNLLANGWHGEGYLDQHAFLLLSDDHWISMSYTQRDVDNLPDRLGMAEPGHVWAGIIQEVENGQVIMEFDTTDYPLLYETAQESTNYDGRSYQDYVHINSVAVDPTDGNILVSMRSQYAVYKIQRTTGEILWVLGGKADQFGIPEEWLFKGQHAASYTAAGTITLFNNNTSNGQTTIFELRLDETAKKVELAKQYFVRDYNGSYCGCVYETPYDTHVIGWGMEFTGTEKLVFSEVDPDTLKEICTLTTIAPEGNATYHSYRTFKSDY